MSCVACVDVDRRQDLVRTPDIRDQSTTTASLCDVMYQPPPPAWWHHGCATSPGQGSPVDVIVSTVSAGSSDRKLSPDHVTASWQTLTAEVGLFK